MKVLSMCNGIVDGRVEGRKDFLLVAIDLLVQILGEKVHLSRQHEFGLLKHKMFKYRR